MTAVALCPADIIPRHFKHLRHSAKTLARMSGASERTAKNWLAGKHAPQLEHVIRLAAECDDLRTDLYAMIEMARAQRRG